MQLDGLAFSSELVQQLQEIAQRGEETFKTLQAIIRTHADEDSQHAEVIAEIQQVMEDYKSKGEAAKSLLQSTKTKKAKGKAKASN